MSSMADSSHKNVKFVTSHVQTNCKDTLLFKVFLLLVKDVQNMGNMGKKYHFLCELLSYGHKI